MIFAVLSLGGSTAVVRTLLSLALSGCSKFAINSADNMVKKIRYILTVNKLIFQRPNLCSVRTSFFIQRENSFSYKLTDLLISTHKM